jgi:hypothetical protein
MFQALKLTASIAAPTAIIWPGVRSSGRSSGFVSRRLKCLSAW